MGVRKIFSRGCNVDILLTSFRLLFDAMHTDVHKTAYFVYTTKKMPHVATVTKMCFVG